jgi:hypothetical protein
MNRIYLPFSAKFPTTIAVHAGAGAMRRGVAAPRPSPFITGVPDAGSLRARRRCFSIPTTPARRTSPAIRRSVCLRARPSPTPPCSWPTSWAATGDLIGVDHNFTTLGQPNVTVVSRATTPITSPGYFGKGFRWQLPTCRPPKRLIEWHTTPCRRRTVGADATVGASYGLPQGRLPGLFR